MKASTLCALLLPLAAQAQTLTELRPAGPTAGAYRWRCAATNFVDAQHIAGACQEKFYPVARYARPVVVGTWKVMWDPSGNPTLSKSVTSWPGCFGTQSVVVLDDVPFYFIAADALGRQLVENNCVSYLSAP